MADAHILILAAGASSRMRGADKLLEQVAGQPLLARIAGFAVQSGAPVRVAVSADQPARNAALAGLALRQMVVPHPEAGMAASLVAGLDGLPPSAAVLLLLADLPEITAADLALMLAEMRADPDSILRGAAADGTPGHPVCFPSWALPELRALTGDAGARAILARHADRVRLIALPGWHATTDLDTPEEWARWRDLHRQ